MTKNKQYNNKIFKEIKNLIEHCDIRLAKTTILAGCIKSLPLFIGGIKQKPDELTAFIECIVGAQMKLDHALIIIKRITKESK
jgi:hypothetical protein